MKKRIRQLQHPVPVAVETQDFSASWHGRHGRREVRPGDGEGVETWHRLLDHGQPF